MNKQTHEEVAAWIRIKLKEQREDIIDLAVSLIIAGAQQGYCEVTESAIYKENPELWCPWCGKLHRSDKHDALSAITEEQWADLNKKAEHTGIYHSPEYLAKQAGLVPPEDE